MLRMRWRTAAPPSARSVRARRGSSGPCAKLTPMLATVLVLSGLTIALHGSWRGYVAARSALVPFVREGDPTRRLIDAARPMHARTRVRVAARQVALAVGWLSLALYGMYLATVGMAVQG
jgi:hypothetical protein